MELRECQLVNSFTLLIKSAASRDHPSGISLLLT